MSDGHRFGGRPDIVPGIGEGPYTQGEGGVSSSLKPTIGGNIRLSQQGSE